MTISFSGTESSSSAPVEVRICFLVDLDSRQIDAGRTGGDDDVLGLDRLFTTVIERDLNLGAAGKTTRALDVGHLVLLEQALDAAGQIGDDLGLALHHLGQIEADLADIHAVIGQLILGLYVMFGRMQQRL